MKAKTDRSLKRVTIGLDLGDKRHTYCVLSAQGEVMKQGSLPNERTALASLHEGYPGATVIMECGTHSPWVSRFLQSLGLKVIVANPRKVRAIFQNERKSDDRDAELLARLGRADPKLLHPITHGSEEAQHDLLQIKLRDSLVRSRVSLITAVRFTLKSLGYRVSNPASERFHKTVGLELPPSCQELIAPMIAAIESLTARIKDLERSITRLATARYPQAQRLQGITGVGPITSLYFVLKVGDPKRFSHGRDVGAYLGLCPRRDQSGAVDKQLRISKCGDGYLRRLLVSAAQYILGPFGRDSALRDYGMRLASSGSKRDKKRAVIAVARKLSVLMLGLWKSQSIYQPYPAVTA